MKVLTVLFGTDIKPSVKSISSSFSKEMGSGLYNSDSNAGSGVWIFNIACFC